MGTRDSLVDRVPVPPGSQGARSQRHRWRTVGAPWGLTPVQWRHQRWGQASGRRVGEGHSRLLADRRKWPIFSPSAARSHGRVLSQGGGRGGGGEGCDLIYVFRHCPGHLVEEGGGRLERRPEPGEWEVLRCCRARQVLAHPHTFPYVLWHIQARQPAPGPSSIPGRGRWKLGPRCPEKQKCGEPWGETHVPSTPGNVLLDSCVTFAQTQGC